MTHENIHVSGLAAPASILVDKWGVPHIRAASLGDMFFVQGFNAARDRLWQIDLWRKRGLGLLAADFGPGYLEQDRAARLFLYRGDMEAEWAAYSRDARAVCEAFARGINAYIDAVEAEPGRLPPEFSALGTRPAKWTAEDVVRIRSHARMRNVLSEVLRAQVTASAGAEADLLRQNLEPPRTPETPAGLDPASIPIEVLDVYKLALAPVSFGRERLDAGLERAEAWRKLTPLDEVVREANGQGSNNWVISGAHTDTGRPILANDPHRAHAVPGLRYLVHMSCPDLDLIGAGEASSPGIMMGHNGVIAFGLTLFFGPDGEDLYVYETSPDDPDLYRYQEGFERMTRLDEGVRVKGVSDQKLTLKFTRHGPVIHEDRARRRAYAVRSVWFEPGAAAYLVSLSAMRAKSYAEFAGHMKRWAVPAVNQVYADVGGDIAWTAAGYSPIRPNWDGLLPVPGDGRYEWAGYLRAGDLPYSLNPQAGWFATANEMNVPADWSVPAERIGFEWIEGSRARRIAEVFAATPVHSVQSSCDLQTDVASLPARRLMSQLAGTASNQPDFIAARALLAGWDATIRKDSAAAALFEVWWAKHLRPALVAAVVADPAVRPLLAPGNPEATLSLLEQPHGRLEGAAAARDRILTDSLVDAYRECAERMGPESAEWRWGRLHHGYFEHALANLTGESGFNVGPLPMGGSDSTPMNASFRPSDFRVTLGASVRMVIDVGGWDNSRCINTPGQSGDPRSPHYSDLALAWSRGEYAPMLYSAAAVEAATEQRIDLIPSEAR